LEGFAAEAKIFDIPLGPDVEQSVRDARRLQAEGYIRRVQSTFADTRRGMSLSNVLYNATTEGERELRAVPPGERPAYIDVLDYQPLKITATRKMRMLAFLLHQIDEKKGEIQRQRTHLLELLSARNPH
jgi:hypothetical protein